MNGYHQGAAREQAARSASPQVTAPVEQDTNRVIERGVPVWRAGRGELAGGVRSEARSHVAAHVVAGGVTRRSGSGSEVMRRPALWRAECGHGAVFIAFRNAFSSVGGSPLQRNAAGFHGNVKRDSARAGWGGERRGQAPRNSFSPPAFHAYLE